MLGSEFVRLLEAHSTYTDRDELTCEMGRALELLWPFVDITIWTHRGELTLSVASDYFAIGTPENYFRAPMSAPSAQRLADKFDCVLPTPMMTDIIWQHAGIQLEPLPWGPPYNESMFSVQRIVAHNQRIADQLAKHSPGNNAIIAGHKKDVVISNRLLRRPTQVAIYGWHRLNGEPIQPLSLVHEAFSYFDYSHGIRFIKRTCMVDGVKCDLPDVLKDSSLAPALSNEGTMQVFRQPGVAGPMEATTPPALHGAGKPLAIGDTGAEVVYWQQWLTKQGYDLGKVDGVFGRRTEAATRQAQAFAGLTITGMVDDSTWKLMTTPLPTYSDVQLPDPIPFIQAKNFKSVADRKLDWIVLHSMENVEKPDTAEAVAKWFGGNSAPEASAHFCVDCDSVVQCVNIQDIAWAAPGANANGIHIELTGYAKQTPEQWADPYSEAMLRLAAKLCAKLCKDHQIPIDFLEPEALRLGERGITTHAVVSEAFKKSNHTDPGNGFPITYFLGLIRACS